VAQTSVSAHGLFRISVLTVSNRSQKHVSLVCKGFIRLTNGPYDTYACRIFVFVGLSQCCCFYADVKTCSTHVRGSRCLRHFMWQRKNERGRCMSRMWRTLSTRYVHILCIIRDISAYYSVSEYLQHWLHTYSLPTLATIVADFGDNLSPKTATVTIFGDNVDRALHAT